MIDVAVIGSTPALGDAVVLDDDVTAAVFDNATDTWQLTTASGGDVRARIVVDGARRLHRPSPPNYPGHNEFRGPTLQWTDYPRAFKPAGQRVAVIGDRAAHVVELLTGYTVQIFDCPPNWRKTKRRGLARVRGRARGPEVVTSPVEEISASGIRTADGTDYGVDTIIYATGCAIVAGLGENALVGSRGLTIQQAWNGGATAYLGVAAHGFPNYFMVLGPDSPVGETAIDTQVRYIAECLRRMRRRGSTRIEVRRSAQRLFTERARVKPACSAFEFSSPVADHEIYDGPATLTLGGTVGGGEHAVRVRLTGHFDPIDGKYHWQGTVSGVEFAPGPGPVQLAIDSVPSAARITEQTPWGSYSIAGVGAPPFGLN